LRALELRIRPNKYTRFTVLKSRVAVGECVLLCCVQQIFARFSSSVESSLIHDQKYGKVFRQRSRQANLRVVCRPQCWVDSPSQSRVLHVLADAVDRL
jgi:hypothetical protein